MTRRTRRLFVTVLWAGCFSSGGCSGCRRPADVVQPVSTEQGVQGHNQPVHHESPSPSNTASNPDRPSPRSDEPPATDEPMAGGVTRVPGEGSVQLGNAGSRADGETFGDGGVPGLTEEGDESTGTEEGATLAARCRGKDSTVIRKMAAVAAAEGDHGTAFGLGTIAWKRINEIPAGSGRDELERQLRADLEEWGRLANSGTSGDRRKTLVDSP